VGDRLFVGVRTKFGMAWRCPQFRVIRFEDPDGEPDWIEHELARRRLPAGSRRRVELDAATLIQAAKLMPKHEGRRASDARLDTAIKAAEKPQSIVAESTIAAWGGDPMGVPPIENDQKQGSGVYKSSRS
jgi:hypothetical protein